MKKFIRPGFAFLLLALITGQVLWASGLLERDAARLVKAKESHLADVDRAFKVYSSQVDRANATLTRIYEPLIKQYEARGDRDTAEQLKAELAELTSEALTSPFPDEEESKKDEKPVPANSHTQLITSIGPEVINASGQRGQTARLVDYDYVMLYFTASWCAPCRAFTPELIRYYNENRSIGKWEVIVVSGDYNDDDFQKYLRTANMPWAAIPFDRLQSSGLVQRYPGGWPRMVVLDRQGRTVLSQVGGQPALLNDFRALLLSR